MAVGASSFAEALAMTAEIYLAAGRLMAESGRRRGVADEGGYWPAFDSNEEAIEATIRAIEAAGLVPGEDAAIALDIAASELGSGGYYRLGLERRELTRDDMCALLIGWCDRYPIVSIEDPLAEDDTEGLRHFTRAVGGRVQAEKLAEFSSERNAMVFINNSVDAEFLSKVCSSAERFESLTDKQAAYVLPKLKKYWKQLSAS